jgi:hypothetical protein
MIAEILNLLNGKGHISFRTDRKYQFSKSVREFYNESFSDFENERGDYIVELTTTFLMTRDELLKFDPNLVRT